MNISLRPLEDKDIPLFKEWLYRPHVAKWYESPQDWITEVENRHGKFSWLHHFIVEADGKPIGFCQYYHYRDGSETWHGKVQTDGTYSIDYMIGEADFLRRGIGKTIVTSLVNTIRTIAGAARVIVQPDENNKPSANTLLSCGFTCDTANGIYVRTL